MSQLLPRVSNLFISNLHLSLKPSGQLEDFYIHVRQVMTDANTSACELPYVHGDRYRGLYELIGAGKGYCRIQFNPLLETNAPLRIELQPQVAGASGLANIRQTLVLLLGPAYDRCMGSASVTQIAINAHIEGAALNDLMITDDRSRKSALVFDQSGAVEQVRLGSDNSDKYLELTNCACEAASDGNNRAVQIMSQQTLRGADFGTLAALENPFEGTYIAMAERARSIGKTTWRLFLDSCARRGVVGALRQISDPDLQRKFRLRISTTLNVGWWNPSDVWLCFPSALMRLGLLPTSPQR